MTNHQPHIPKMKRAFPVLLTILFVIGCTKKDEPEPPADTPPPTYPLYTHWVEGSECVTGTHSDVFMLNEHDPLPHLAPGGIEILVHIWGEPTTVGDVTTWAPACYSLKVDGVVVGTYHATAPQEFRYTIPE